MTEERLEINACCFNTAISSQSGLGEGSVQQAEALFKQMQTSRVQPTLISYSAIIDVAAKEGDIYKAETWLSRMLEAGHQPGPVTTSLLMNAYAVAGDALRAEHYLVESIKAGFQPTTIEFNIVMKAWAMQKQAARAEQWLHQMVARNVQPNEVTYGTLVNGRAEIGDLPGARHWFSMFESTGGRWSLVFYTTFIKACAFARPRNKQGAQLYMRQLVEQGFKPNYITLQALAQALDVENAKKLCQELNVDWESIFQARGKGRIRFSGKSDPQDREVKRMRAG